METWLGAELGAHASCLTGGLAGWLHWLWLCRKRGRRTATPYEVRMLAVRDHGRRYATSGAKELQHHAKQESVLALHDHVRVNASEKADGTCAPASDGGLSPDHS